MKNTLKTVITLLLINFSLTTYAQEKQNDATWEECIEFINDNIGSIIRYTYKDNQYSQGEMTGSMIWSFQYSINNTEFSAKQHRDIYSEYGNRSDKPVYSLKLKNLKIAENGPNYETINTKLVGEDEKNFGTITIRTTSELSMGKEYAGESNDVSSTQMILIIEENEMRERMLKAFKQLAYLAAEKRKDSKF